MKRVQKQQESANSDDSAQNERVSAFPQINSLHQAVDDREAIGNVVESRLHPFERVPLIRQVFAGFHRD